jgi:hypothetical protein
MSTKTIVLTGRFSSESHASIALLGDSPKDGSMLGGLYCYGILIIVDTLLLANKLMDLRFAAM